jgi:transcriptional regulator with XRE-family HTH domain
VRQDHSRGDRDAGETRTEFRREARDAFIVNLKRLRAQSGLSQENLSLRASLVRTHVGLIENGERLPEIDTIHRLAGALGVEPGELLTGFYWRPDGPGRNGRVTSKPPEDGGGT